MSICASGTSQPKPGTPTSVHVDAAYAKSLLPAALAYLYDYLPFMHGLEIGNVATFCAADPPIIAALPTAQQIAEFISGSNLSSYLNVNTFLQNLTKTYLWYGLCQCSDITSPALPSTPANPGNLIAINPPNYVAPPASTCDHYASPEVGPLSNSSDTALINSDGLFAIRPLPVGATSLIFTAKNIAAGATPGSYEFLLRAYTGLTAATEVGTGAVIGSDSIWNRIVASGATATWTVPVINTWAGITLEVGRHTAGQISNHAQATMDVYCNNGQPGRPLAPCCPPDPVAAGLLTQILQAVTLIQRQSVPFSYIAGTAHTALSGSGTIAISGLLGAKIAITTLPSQLGQAGTLPVEIFDAGFITFSTPDGYPQSYRIEHNPHLLLPARCSAYTQLNYDLHPGVVATITEIVREP